MVNIPNKSDGQILYASELFKLVSKTSTAGTWSGAGTSTIGTAVVDANSVSSGVLVIANGKFANNSSNNNTGTYVLWGGTATTGTRNTAIRTITRHIQNNTAENDCGWSFSEFVTGLTWTQTIYFHITAYNEGSGNGVSSFESMVVLGV
jgi:hypothetical protein